MKVATFENGATIYFADLEGFTISRSMSSPFYDQETGGALNAYCVTIEHPNIPDRAWIVFPYEIGQEMPVQEVFSRFYQLLQDGVTVWQAAITIRDLYFSTKDFALIFDQHSNYRFDVTL